LKDIISVCVTEAELLAAGGDSRTWKHEIGQIAAGADLHGTEHRQIDSAGADHGEGFVGAEDGGAGEEGDGFFAGVDEVGVFLACGIII
jgi:hypothetical protein